jgi:hypothetical protein
MEIETKLAADVIVARHEVARELEEAIGKLVPHWDLTCQNPEGGGTPLTRKCHEDRLSWDGRDGLPYCREAARVMRVVSEDLEVPLVPGGTADDLAAQLAAALQGTVDNLEQWNRETRGYLELYRALREVRR